MKLFGCYLLSNKKNMVLPLIFFFFYFLSFALFQVSASVIIYSSLWCFTICFFYIIWDFYGFWKKHKKLRLIGKQKIFDIESLPESAHVLEQDYQNLIQLLIEERNHLELEKNDRYADMMDYYTVWVHQIKTPIASLYLKLQDEDSDFSRELKTQLQEIEQYVEMVLCYLRLDSESTDYVIRECDLDVIVKQEVKKLALQFIRKKICLEYEPLNCMVLTDEKWLAFVVGQVLSNAMKYTKEGSIRIVLEKPQTLCICDTGIGIAEEDLPRIFEKGFTGFNGRADKKASGIGLYLCKRICDNMGHKIMVESLVDKGTTVRISLEHKPLDVE